MLRHRGQVTELSLGESLGREEGDLHSTRQKHRALLRASISGGALPSPLADAGPVIRTCSAPCPLCPKVPTSMSQGTNLHVPGNRIFSPEMLYEFPLAAVTNCYKLSGLKQPKCVILEF